MQRTILAVIALALLKTLAPIAFFTRANPASLPRAVNQDGQARTRQKELRSVKGRTLTSHVLPPIEIKFDKAFKYVGSQQFVLYDRAQVEQFFFVAANRGSIKRMFMVQFEGYLPDNTHTYDYNIKETVRLGELDFMSDNAVVNVPAFRKQYPDSDAGRAAAFLETKGYVLAGEDIIFQRFVRLVDEARRNEVLILYYETLNEKGFTAASLSDGGKAASQRDRLFEEVRQRALKGFTVAKR